MHSRSSTPWSAGVGALVFALCAGMSIFGCGAPPKAKVPTVQVDTASLDVPSLLRSYGKTRSPAFVPPEASLDALEQARKEAEGPSRIKALRDLAVAHLWAAEAAIESKDKREHYRIAERSAEKALAGNGDPASAADAEFVLVWCAWRRAIKRADSAAELFLRRRADAAELVTIVRFIRGEIALEARRWSDASSHYRYLLGQLDHSLYALALYRTAETRMGANKEAEAKEMFTDARDLGCKPSASSETLLVSAFAAAQTNTGVRRDAAGKMRPASCAFPEDAKSGTKAGGGADAAGSSARRGAGPATATGSAAPSAK